MYRLLLVVFVMSLFLITGCSKKTQRIYRPSVKVEKKALSNKRQAVLKHAKSFEGVKYKYGGTSHSGFDCSGLTYRSFEKAGVQIPRTSSAQSALGHKIRLDQAKPGDLLFFSKGTKINHVALLYEKKGHKYFVIHSTSSRGVIIEDFRANNYWNSRFKFASSILD